MFNVNYRDVIIAVTPHFLRKDNFKRILFSIIKPLQTLNNNGTPIQFFNQKNVSLFPFTLFITRFLQVEQTTLGIQKYLNELFDPTDELIEIVNNNTPLLVDYDFNNSEVHIIDFGYNNWDSTVDYAATGEFVLGADGEVYESNTTPNLNNEPPNASWDLISTDDEFLFNEADIYPPDYTIKLPVIITADPDNLKLIQATINQFNAAGKSYEGVSVDEFGAVLEVKFEKN